MSRSANGPARSPVFLGPQTPWGWLGLVPLVTGSLGACPVYRLLGRGSCSR
ncbi:DUF2892 domain-containing protein [Pseudomonas triclosanedens]|uniref:YgaP family membrane protein n=1 Tax=Pseudomonas triclosanedens TaxID=2961893 RepID=UPI002E237F89